MLLEPKPGASIPCRKRGKIAMVILSPRKNELRCAEGNRTTLIAARQESSGWTVRTDLVTVPLAKRKEPVTPLSP